MEQMLRIAKARRLLRPRDLAQANIPRVYLRRACDQGRLVRVGRGLYQLPDILPSENQSLAEVCRRAPGGVICLLSALRFHDLTTQNPHEVWLALAPKSHAPRMDTVALRVVRFSGEALKAGIEKHDEGGVELRVYGPAKTIADCFKFRNKIGLDVAIEALRACLRQRKASVDELVRFARICRVERAMSPYLEAML